MERFDKRQDINGARNSTDDKSSVKWAWSRQVIQINFKAAIIFQE